MSNRLICDRPDVFKGAGVITATMDRSFYNNCNPDRPVGIVVMNGTKDYAIPYDGGKLEIGGKVRADVISTDEYMEFWAEHNNCSGSKPVVHLPDSEPDDGTTVSVLEFTGCDNGGKVILYAIHGGGHTWPGGQDETFVTRLMEHFVGETSHEINAIDVMWDFFMGL
jgi:polyhydroxybutyrate depolymerase